MATIEQLMADLSIDRRIKLPEDKAPDNEADRKAVLVFFDAMVRCNVQSFKGMLPLADQLELTALVDAGQLKPTIDKIKQVEIQTGKNSLNQKCALAVIEVADGPEINFQPQLWYYTTDSENPLFEAAPTPPGILDKLSGDWIAAWHQILADELAQAEKTDVDVAMAQRNLDSGDDKSKSGGSSPSTSGGGNDPASGGGRPLRDPSASPPERAPG
jgi:hypothetical protein